MGSLEFSAIFTSQFQKFVSSVDYTRLSKRYLQGKGGFENQKERMAYIIARMPATFTAICQVLKELKGAPIRSLIDWGSGPGSGIWAARTAFPELTKAHLIDSDFQIVQLGKEFTKNLSGITWIVADAISLATYPPCDLSLFSYSLGEIPKKSQIPLLLKAWKTSHYLLVIEPGTPKRFERMLLFREALLKEGAYILAPCPHARLCPMNEQKNWCHFSVRLARTKEHRIIKEAYLGYEDEKFCYLLVGKTEKQPDDARVIGHPQKGNGYITLPICGKKGLKSSIVAKRQKTFYRSIRKLKWGETFNFPNEV